MISNDTWVNSLDIIMEKISNLKEYLLNISLNDNYLQKKFFSLKSKNFDYSNLK